VECECDPEQDGDQAVTLASIHSGTWVRLWNRVDPWDDGSIQVCAEIGGEGLRAVAHRVVVSIYDDTLTPFLENLAERFRGWDGTLTWQSMEPGLEIAAVSRSRGEVELSWTVQPSRSYSSTWQATVPVSVEAGEQLRRFAAQVYRFLHRDQ
jgi:hypothetical protein